MSTGPTWRQIGIFASAPISQDWFYPVGISWIITNEVSVHKSFAGVPGISTFELLCMKAFLEVISFNMQSVTWEKQHISYFQHMEFAHEMT